MDKPIISYINDYVGVNYSDIYDFLKDLQYNTPEFNTNLLLKLLLNIEAMENKENKEVVTYFSPFTGEPVMVETETNKYMVDVKKVIEKEWQNGSDWME